MVKLQCTGCRKTVEAPDDCLAIGDCGCGGSWRLFTGEFKYGNVAGLEAKLLPGEPWFALRAKDLYSIRGVEAYLALCEEMGLVDHAAGVRQALKQMQDWRDANPDKVKMPD